MKRCQPKPRVRATLRRLFRPSCERLEDLIAPNDFGVFRALHPLAGWLDSLGSDIQIVGQAQASNVDTPAFVGPNLEASTGGSTQSAASSVDALFAGDSANSSAATGSASPETKIGSDASEIASGANDSPFANPLFTSFASPFAESSGHGGSVGGAAETAPGSAANVAASANASVGDASGSGGGVASAVPSAGGAASSAQAPAGSYGMDSGSSSPAPGGSAAGAALQAALPSQPKTATVVTPANSSPPSTVGEGADSASLTARTNGDVVNLSSPGHPLQAVQALNAPPASQGQPTLPWGLYSFQVTNVTPGGSAVVTMTLPAGAHPTSYYKTDPATGNLIPFNYDGGTGAEIHGNVISLHLVDGGPGDADGVANGVIVDPGGPSNDGDLSVSASNQTFTEATPRSNFVVGTFTDADNNHDPSKYTATIAWGDQTSSQGTVSGSGPFTVTASHTYLEEGTKSASVTVSDTDGASGAANFTSTVSDAALTAHANNIAAVSGVAYTGVVAGFTDADPNGTVSDYTTTTIAWGDGGSS